MTGPESRSVEVQRRAKAPPEVVFAYFVDPAKHALWQGEEVVLDPRPGGVYAVRFTESGWVRGEFVLVEPPKRLVLRWGVEDGEGVPEGIAPMRPSSTTVEVNLIPDGEGTIIHVLHTGLPTAAAAAFTNTGWTVYTERLVVVVEGGEPGIDPLLEALRRRRAGLER